MKRKRIIFLGIIIFLSNNVQQFIYAQQHNTIAFQRENYISTYNIKNNNINQIIKGSDPCISPDGKYIAYTSATYEKDFTRVIKIIDIETLKTTKLNIKNNNHYGAIWSPSSKYIAFNILTDGWSIGIINIESSEVVILKTDSKTGVFAPTWNKDSNYIFAHDLRKIYKFNLNGEVIETHDLKKLFGKNMWFSSSSRFFFTSNENIIVFTADVNESMEGLFEPPTAIFYYNMNSKEIFRISPKGICVNELWLDYQNNIYFSGFKDINGFRNIYETSIKNNSIKLIIENARDPSR